MTRYATIPHDIWEPLCRAIIKSKPTNKRVDLEYKLDRAIACDNAPSFEFMGVELVREDKEQVGDKD